MSSRCGQSDGEGGRTEKVTMTVLSWNISVWAGLRGQRKSVILKYMNLSDIVPQ